MLQSTLQCYKIHFMQQKCHLFPHEQNTRLRLRKRLPNYSSTRLLDVVRYGFILKAYLLFVVELVSTPLVVFSNILKVGRSKLMHVMHILAH